MGVMISPPPIVPRNVPAPVARLMLQNVDCEAAAFICPTMNSVITASAGNPARPRLIERFNRSRRPAIEPGDKSPERLAKAQHGFDGVVHEVMPHEEPAVLLVLHAGDAAVIARADEHGAVARFGEADEHGSREGGAV